MKRKQPQNFYSISKKLKTEYSQLLFTIMIYIHNNNNIYSSYTNIIISNYTFYHFTIVTILSTYVYNKSINNDLLFKSTRTTSTKGRAYTHTYIHTAERKQKRLSEIRSRARVGSFPLSCCSSVGSSVTKRNNLG